MRRKIRPLPVVAALLVVAGLALMLGSLRIEQTRGTETVATEASVAVIPTAAAVAVATGTPRASEPRATRLFERAQTANRSLTYGGVKLVSRWESGRASSVVVAVTHLPGRGTTVAPADTTGSPSPAAAAVTVAAGAVDESAMLTALVRNYRLTEVGSSTMIGRPTTSVEADRADGSVAARFWVDDGTGLVLRRELLDDRGRIVESAAFLRFDVDPVVATPSVQATGARTWTVLDASGIDALRVQGWPVPTALRGGMDLYQVRRQTTPDGAVVQLSYTDGLVAMSVFLQKGALDSASLSGYTAVTSGGGQVWVRDSRLFFVWQSRLATVAGESPSTPAGSGVDASHDIVVSATTDSPLAPIGSVLAVLPPQPAAADGVSDRVARGVHRVTSWFDPLG